MRKRTAKQMRSCSFSTWANRLMSVTSRFLIVGLSIFAASCAPKVLWAPLGETHPDDALTLQVKVTPGEASSGDSIALEYLLTNVTDRAVSGCADDWGGYHIWAKNSEQGEQAVRNDRVEPSRVFRIPPHATLSWKTNIVLKNLAAGDATIRGIFRSTCSLWQGTAISQPVQLVIR
jgi:hypothetical protein